MELSKRPKSILQNAIKYTEKIKQGLIGKDFLTLYRVKMCFFKNEVL